MRLNGRLLNGKPWVLSLPIAAASPVTPDWDTLTPYTQVGIGWKNANTVALTTPFVTTLHETQRGDIPAGFHAGLFLPDGTAVPTQQDGETLPHTDGSLAAARLSAYVPGTTAAGAAASLLVKPVSGAPDRTPKFSLAAWAAANDIRILIKTNLANPADTTQQYEFAVSDAIAAGMYEGSSTGADYPLTSIRVDRSGPLCMGWRFRGYGRRKSDGAYHRTLLGEVYVTAQTLSDNQIDGLWGQPNAVDTSGVYNASQTVGPAAVADFKPIFGIVEVWNGATLLKTIGGPSDYRKVTFGASPVDLTANMITFPTLTGAQRSRQALGYVFQSTGTLPGGMNPNRVYFPKQDYYQDKCQLLERRSYFLSQGTAAYAPSAAVQEFPYSSVYVGANPGNGPAQLYACTKAGTTGASSAPSGTADNQVDGTAEWSPFNVLFTNQGTGTLTAWPVVGVSPLCAAPVMDDQTSDPIWTGSGPAPLMEVQLDLTYLTRYARALPPFDLTLTPLYPDACPFDGVSVGEAIYPSVIDDFGDNPGTALIGYLSFAQANGLLQQTSVQVQRHMRMMAFAWMDHWTYANDPRSMQPVVGLQGPGNATGRFAGMGPSIPKYYYCFADRAPGRFSGIGSTGNANYYAAKYQTLCAGSHLPSPGLLAYKKTGRAIFLDLSVSLANCAMLSAADNSGNHQRTVAGTTYSAAWLVNEQPRGSAWTSRAVAMASQYMPASHPSRAHFTDMLDNALSCAAATIENTRVNFPLAYARGAREPSDSVMQLWMLSYELLVYSTEARKGRDTRWRGLASYLASNLWLQWLDAGRGGNPGLADWNNIVSLEYSVNAGIAAGDVIAISAYDANTSSVPSLAGTPLPTVSYTVPSGAARASVAAGITALINATAAYTSYGFVAVCDNSDEWFRVRLPGALFSETNARAYSLLLINDAGGSKVYNTGIGTHIIRLAPAVAYGPPVREFANWAAIREYNLGPGWSQSNASNLSMVGVLNSFKGTSGDFPWDNVTYCWAAVGAAAAMIEAGIGGVAVQTFYDDVLARIAGLGGGPVVSGTASGQLTVGQDRQHVPGTYPNFLYATFARQAVHVQH